MQSDGYNASVPDLRPLLDRERGALVIRHGPRFGGDVALDSDGLTDAGKEAALNLGKRLPAHMEIRFFSSPIGRCIDTAKMIAEGAGIDAEITISRMLAKPGPYPIDEAQVEKYCQDETLHRFMIDWVEGRVPDAAIGPLPDGAELLVSHVLGHLREKDRGLDIHVGHDIFLTPVPIRYLGYDVCSLGLLGFLDGFTAVVDGEDTILSHSGRSVRLRPDEI